MTMFSARHGCLENFISKRKDSTYRSGRSPGGLAAGGRGGLGIKANQGGQFEISIYGVPRTPRDRQDIALQTARLLKSQNPNSVVKMKDLRTGEETIVAFKPGE